MPESMKQITFTKLDEGMGMPHLLDIQTRAFQSLLQKDTAALKTDDVGLERVFKELFPISDVHENFSLEFVSYVLGEPKYSDEECIERDMTYSAPLKATLQLVINEDVNGLKRPQHHPEGGLPWRAAAAHRVGHLRDQRRRTRHREPAAPLTGRGLRGVDAPERTAPDLVADHSVPWLVGRVHGGHSRRHLRPRSEERR